MKGVRDSKLGGGKDEFESKSELDELFQGFDVAVVGAKTVGTLNFEELKNGLMNELKFRTNLKNLDHVACGAVIESMRRGFAAVKDIDADGDSSLSRGEFRILLIYLERYYALYGAHSWQPSPSQVCGPNADVLGVRIAPWEACKCSRWLSSGTLQTHAPRATI